MSDSSILEQFESIVTGPDENINLVEMALLIACNEYPQLDSTHYLRMLDTMADGLQAFSLNCDSLEDSIETLNQFMFDELGFSGDLTTFNDPRNSYLNDVLDRKQGIPLTLSVIYMELGRRIGLPFQGISFPGHFLVQLSLEEGDLILDPFSGGAVLDEKELQQRLQQFSKTKQDDWDLDDFLEPASNKDILARMLRNLKTIYLEAEDFEHALEVVNFLLVMDIDSPLEVRDRAHIYDQLDCFRAAIEDYQKYLILSPAATDSAYVQTRLTDLKLSAERLH